MSGPTVRVWLQSGWKELFRAAGLPFNPQKVEQEVLGQHFLYFDDATSLFVGMIPEKAVLSVSYQGYRLGEVLVEGRYWYGAAGAMVVTEQLGAQRRQKITCSGPARLDVDTLYWRVFGKVADDLREDEGEKRIMPLKRALQVPERRLIITALRIYGGNRGKTAAALRINRTTLFNKMRMHGLLDGGWEVPA